MKIYYNDPEVYQGTYNFRDDADGAEPEGWTTNNGGACTTTIISSFDGHRKVLQLYDPDGSRCELEKDFGDALADDVHELWVAKSSIAANTVIIIHFWEGATRLFYFYFEADDLIYNGGNVKLAFFTTDTFFHIKVIPDDSANTFDLYINGVLEGNDLAYENNSTTGIEKTTVHSNSADLGYYGYVDAWGTPTRDTDYAIGDNCFWRHYKESEADTFEEDDVGTQGTSITWVDTTLTAIAVEIIEEFNEHKKIIRQIESAGNDWSTHNFASASTAGWFSTWIKSNDYTGISTVYLQEGSATLKLIFKFDSDKFQIHTGGAWRDVTNAPIPIDNTWYHLYFQWYADNTFDLWIDNVQYEDGTAFYANMVAGIDNIQIQTITAGDYLYLDAPISSLDGDTKDDNRLLEDDWVELTTIKSYPEVRNRMDETSQISFTLNDFEGALYSKWSEHNFIGIKVLDDDDIVLFRGYLTGKKFTHDKLLCTAHGLSVRLDWIPLRKNYVEAEGIVKTIPYAGTDVPDLDGTYIVPDATPTADWTHNSVSDLADTIDNGDGTYVSAGDGDESVILEYSFPACPAGVTTIQEITVNCRCKYLGNVKTIGVTLSEDNGVGWEDYQYITPTTVFANKTKIFTGLSLASADVTGNLLVRFRANGAYGIGDISRVAEIDVEFSNFTGASAYALELETTDEALLNWTADQFVNDTDMGILIVDNTGNIATLTFEAMGNPVVTNGTYVSGDKEGLDTKYDALTYKFKDTTTPHNAYITVATGDAGGIADTQTLHKIEINYRIGVYRSWFLFGLNPPTKLTIKILDDDSYDNNAFVIYESSDAVGAYEWVEGTLTIEDSDTNLQKFLTKTGADYTGLVGLRLYLEGWALNLPATVSVDLLDVTIYYAAVDVSPIMEQIDSNGAEYVLVDGRTWVSTELTVGDSFKIGPISTTVLTDIFTIAGVNFYLLSTLTHYIAQLYRGTYCKEILKKICLLEGLHWWEDHAHNRVIISAEVDFADSTEDLTQANYAHDWEFEDDNNYYSGVDMYGKASLEIYYRAEDLDIDSPRTKVIIEETITTLPEAQEVADAQLAEYKTKRPSIKIPLKGVYDNLRVGTTVGLTMVRPTVAEADYPIRMTERERFGGSIKTIIYCGLGHASVQERIANTINKGVLLAHQAHTDRLTAK